MMHRFLDRVRERGSREQGFYMVWFALTFVTLTAFAGLALEYNRWPGLESRPALQKAADAAALGGAVFLLENVGNKAYTTAQDARQPRNTASPNGSNGVTITTAVGKLPNQLKVTVSTINTAKNPWGSIVGYTHTTIVRSAVAEYQLPQNLGSPQNSYGNDPESTVTPQPQFWGNVFGPRRRARRRGDAENPVAWGRNGQLRRLCNSDNLNGRLRRSNGPKP